MVHYIQRECNVYSTFANGAIIRFDTPIALSETSAQTPSEDFVYQEDGSIDILRAGTYTVFWYVASMAGQSTAGQSYLLKKMDYSLPTPDWASVAGTSNHIKVSQTVGFAVIDILQDEIDAHARATVAVFNTADAAANLTLFVPKAGILIFGLSADALENRLDGIDGQISTLFDTLESIERFVHLSDVTEIPSQTPELLGLGAAVISSGYTYNFWGTGTLNHQQTLTQGVVYTLIDSGQFTPLSYYQGDSTIGTLWVEVPAPDGEIFSMPIRFDGTGIFFIPGTTYENLPVGTAFRFTQSLILVDPAREGGA
ncbi:MAG: hypothetical protein FWB88_07935 [Defluviitaleaceae bacterium]|nr:hypothetical protein [Defluviitaleaceae bacterium]MCL2240460.1 hypothetical protein [Defluviitaleaceae bacterium]